MRRLPVLLLLLIARTAAARELHWSEFAVKARLEASGKLSVVERQTIVFTGDWNGGYRTFRLEPGQSLDFGGIRRIDAATREAIPLVKGDLDAVDHFAWSGPKEVRWRSRLPSDPPFENTAITYELAYTLTGVLSEADGAYELNHDFAFPDRESEIDGFTLDFELDPAWRALARFPTHLERERLPQGAGVVVSGALTYSGPGRPVSRRVLTPRLQIGVLAAAGALLVVLLLRYRQWEAAAGRYRPLVPAAEVTPEWLKQNLLSWKAEEAGAGLHGKVGPPEVAAVLARLVAERKIESRVEEDGKNLHLALKAPRAGFTGYEKELIGKLFFGGDSTDTTAIRKHYESRGFDPATILRKPLLARTAEGTGPKRKTPRWEKAPAWLLWIAALAFIGLACRVRDDIQVLLGCGAATFVAAIVGAFAGSGLSSRWRRQWGPGLDALLPFFLIPAALPLAVPAIVAWERWAPGGGLFTPSVPIVLASAFLGLALSVSWFLGIRSEESPALLDRRRKLASARRFFEEELEKPAPALHDDWYPYIVAFGLDRRAARWLGRFGGAAAEAGGTTGRSDSTSGSSSSSSSSSSPGPSWTGGGGSFGGAGASVSWAAAAASVASGVSAPSSGGSGGGGGGGGGGSSSGGGGGGGW